MSGNAKETKMFFKNFNTVAEVKSEYRKLAKQYHPDLNSEDTTETMKQINVEYHETLQAMNGQTSTSERGNHTYKYNASVEQAIMDKIKEILAENLEGIEVWLIGLWVWVKGDTKPHSKALGKNGLGLQYHGKRKCWYWKPYKSRTTYSGKSLNQLANQYGATKFESPEAERQAITA